MQLSANLDENLTVLKKLLPLDMSFDFIQKHLVLGQTRAFCLCLNGMCRTDILQTLFSDLQDPGFTKDGIIEDLLSYQRSKIGFTQVSLTDDFETLVSQVLCGPAILLVDGCRQALILDARIYPTRSIAEPDHEQITRGARDGFVETLTQNTTLIRRHIRSPRLTFELFQVGTVSGTDVAVSYLEGTADPQLVRDLRKALTQIRTPSLTMGAKSLEELLVRKRWYHPLPSMQVTERPDVAGSYLTEGYVLVLVDNSPQALVLPCSILQFTQSPEDYVSDPVVGTYFRLVRLGCSFISLFLMPVFLLLTVYYPAFSERYGILSEPSPGKIRLIFYVYAVEFLLDLFKYSNAHSSKHFTGSLSVVGGLIIGDMAVSLNWATPEVLFYAAVTLLTTLALTSLEFGDGLRLYRLFLLTVTGIGGLWGFLFGTVLVLWSAATTPAFGKKGYLWPILPFDAKALRSLLVRYNASSAGQSEEK